MKPSFVGFHPSRFDWLPVVNMGNVPMAVLEHAAVRSWILGDSAEASRCTYRATDETVKGDLESCRRARVPFDRR